MPEEKKLRVNGLIDRMIYRLTRERHLDGFSDEEVVYVLDKAFQLMVRLPALIEMKTPLVIFGEPFFFILLFTVLTFQGTFMASLMICTVLWTLLIDHRRRECSS